MTCWGVILTGLDIKRDRGRDRGLDHQAFNKKIGDSCTTITHGMTGEKNYIITLAPSRNRSHLHHADHVLKRIPFFRWWLDPTISELQFERAITLTRARVFLQFICFAGHRKNAPHQGWKIVNGIPTCWHSKSFVEQVLSPTESWYGRKIKVTKQKTFRTHARTRHRKQIAVNRKPARCVYRCRLQK